MTCPYCDGRGWLIVNEAEVQSCDGCDDVATHGVRSDEQAAHAMRKWITRQDADRAVLVAACAFAIKHVAHPKAQDVLRAALDQAAS